MSGHSKWATIKHKKAATDAKRGQAFTRIIREITIAARIGGGDPNSNPRLRTAILAGKNENMPNENIERAILRGTGQLEGEQYEEATFEGYGPGGVGMLIQVVTTNRNRVVGEFRHLMSKNGGNLAEAGAVGWMFHRKGEISVPKEAASEDKLLDLVLDAGAEDLKDDGSAWYIVTPPEALEKVKDALTKAGIKPTSAEIAMVPQNYIKLTGPQAVQMVRLVEALEEHDDRSEEHTSELQSRLHLVCRLLLEKKKILHPPGKALDVNHSMFTVVLDQIADDIHSYPFRLFEHRADQCLHDTSSLPHCSPMPVP